MGTTNGTVNGSVNGAAAPKKVNTYGTGGGDLPVDPIREIKKDQGIMLNYQEATLLTVKAILTWMEKGTPPQFAALHAALDAARESGVIKADPVPPPIVKELLAKPEKPPVVAAPVVDPEKAARQKADAEEEATRKAADRLLSLDDPDNVTWAVSGRGVFPIYRAADKAQDASLLRISVLSGWSLEEYRFRIPGAGEAGHKRIVAYAKAHGLRTK